MGIVWEERTQEERRNRDRARMGDGRATRDAESQHRALGILGPSRQELFGERLAIGEAT
jgi:hypothetical protein